MKKKKMCEILAKRAPRSYSSFGHVKTVTKQDCLAFTVCVGHFALSP